jgi:cold shock CspA family protein
MNFKDVMATNEQGEQFIFTVEMQRRLSEAGLPVEPGYLSQLPQQLPQSQGERRDEGRREEGRRDEGRRDEGRRDEGRRDEGRRDEGRRDEGRRNGADDQLEPETIQIDPETGKYIGRMKWYNESRGYGFIARGGGQDIFFHKSSTMGDPNDLQEGQWVLYDVEEKKKGPEATEVEPYEGAAVTD